MGNLFQTIVLNSLNMTLVALLLMIILRALKNIQSPKIRYYSWMIVLLGFLIPVRFSFGYALFHVSNASEAPAVTVGAGTTVIKAAEAGLSWNTIMAILFVIWILGAGAFATVSFVRFFRWKRTILRLSKPSPYYDAFISTFAEEMEIGPVEVRISDEISSPMMIGLFKPTILLPIRHYEYDELRLIIKHELTHYLHRDLWFKLLLILCRAVHWFNPFMVLFARSIEQECEYYCDMSVMEKEPEKMRKVYCNSIVNTLADQVRRNGREMRPVLATSFYSPKSGLKHRFSMVLRGKTRKVIGVLILAGMLTVVSGFVLGGNRKNTEKSSRSNGKNNSTGFFAPSEERVANTEWSEQEVEETTWAEDQWIEETTWTDESGLVETTDYEEYTTWVEDEDQVVSSAYAEASDYEPSVSESVMWTGEMETSDETQVAETFISEQYEVMPSIG